MVEAIQHWAIYLKGTKFHVKTDCLSLEKLFQKSNAAMIRRLIELSEYQFTLEHVAGVKNEFVTSPHSTLVIMYTVMTSHMSP